MQKRIKYLIYNISILVFSVGMGFTSHNLFAEGYDKVALAIVSNHTRSLDRKNMYEKPLDSGDLGNWFGVFKVVEDFVEKNSKKNKQQLTDFFMNIRSANDDLINGIKITYGTKGNEELVGRQKKMFSSIVRNMELLEKTLQWVASKDANENDVIKLLGMLAKYVKVTARKAGKDI